MPHERGIAFGPDGDERLVERDHHGRAPGDQCAHQAVGAHEQAEVGFLRLRMDLVAEPVRH